MSVDIVPKDVRNNRACLVCSLIKVNINNCYFIETVFTEIFVCFDVDAYRRLSNLNSMVVTIATSFFE